MSVKEAPIVEVLKFDESEAYNHDRAISSLVRTQLLHLHHAENIKIPKKARTNVNINQLLTELQASEYIQRVTALLHRYGKRAGVGRSKPKRKSTEKTVKQSAQKGPRQLRKKKRSRLKR